MKQAGTARITRAFTRAEQFPPTKGSTGKPFTDFPGVKFPAADVMIQIDGRFDNLKVKKAGYVNRHCIPTLILPTRRCYFMNYSRNSCVRP
jgi:hypothetical protein